MAQARRHFHDELAALERSVQTMGADVQELFAQALVALADQDPELCRTVIAGDDAIDRAYLHNEMWIMDLLALQAPVATDLRLISALLHITLHLERIADMAVNIAKIVKLASGLPRNERVLEHLEEMGAVAQKMLGAAMHAFAQRDLELCHRLPEMDDPIDRLNRGMLAEVLEASDDKAILEWGIRMHVVSRQIERIGDHAVDIGEQVAFLVTGEFVEFVDASHPERGIGE
jgi:phosphate transport system protein